MMKKKIYIVYTILLSLVFAACSEEETENINSGDRKILNFSLSVPEHQIYTTKAAFENTVNNIWLLVFDANGLFIERVQATNLTASTETTGTFKAQVSTRAGIIHFVANYDQWATFSDAVAYQKSEKEIIPSLVSGSLIFWGRSTVSNITIPINVTLYRNQAKVTIENQASPAFEVTGFAILNYSAQGTACPFDGTLASPFTLSSTVPTMPAGTVAKVNQTVVNCDLTPKYMSESHNHFDDQVYIILKGKLNSGPELFYKVQLLDANKQPYPVIRNYLYKVVVKSFNGNANGSTTFDDAKTAEPSNNVYAQIFRDSPTVSDASNNVLTVSKMNFLFINSGTLSLTASYIKNGVPGNSLISVSVIEDQDNILNGLSYNGIGTVTASIPPPVATQRQATFTVKAGVLSRTITVISSPSSSFLPTSFSPALYTAKDQAVALNFTIPSTIPDYFFPMKCLISTKNLYPISPNKNMQLEYYSGDFKYVYWATSPGTKSLNFNTSFENSDETVTIENDYFVAASVDLKARHFTSVSVNNNNIVSYGNNNTATLRFTLSDVAGSPATYPLTVFVATNNLKITQTGWTAVTGGYSYTYSSAPTGIQTANFTSNKNISREKIVLSAAGFAPTTLSFDNTLSSNTTISGSIRVLVNGTQTNLNRYDITSSNTNIISSFTTSSSSAYSVSVKSGSALSDMVTFTVSYSSNTYTGSYTVEQLLGNPTIIMQR